MVRAGFAAALGAALCVGVAMAAGPRPAVLANAAPGLWEISGLPGIKTPPRECFGDVALLAQYEHKRRNCTRSIVSDGIPSAVIQYDCQGAGFGRSKLTMITPRSIRIETQGISDGLPFNYVLQARRVGECARATPATAH